MAYSGTNHRGGRLGTRRFVDRTGQVYGKLTVQWPIGSSGRGKRGLLWLCLCECGQLSWRYSCQLAAGLVRSCGCLKEKHGASSHKNRAQEYDIYLGAKSRCNYPRNIGYPNYGGRGIRFLFRKYSEFLAEVGPRPSPEHTLDRIDNDGHYAPGNVRWATRSEQTANRRVRFLKDFSDKQLLEEVKRRNLSFIGGIT